PTSDTWTVIEIIEDPVVEHKGHFADIEERLRLNLGDGAEDSQVKQLNPLFKVEDEGVIVNEPAYAEGAQGVLPTQTAPFEEGNRFAADRGFQSASKDEGVLLGGVRNQPPVFDPIPTEYRVRTGREGLRQLCKHRKVVTDRWRHRVVACVVQVSQPVAPHRPPARSFDRGKHRLREGEVLHHARL